MQAAIRTNGSRSVHCPIARVVPAIHNVDMLLLERDSALASLVEYARQARAGDGRLVLVAGEAGVGKSTLVEALEPELAGRARWSLGRLRRPVHAAPARAAVRLAEQLGGELLDAVRGPAPAGTSCSQALLRQISPAGAAQRRRRSRTCTGPTRRRSTCCASWPAAARACPCCSSPPTATTRLAASDPLRLALGELATQRSTRRVDLRAAVARGGRRARRRHRPRARRALPAHRRQPVLRHRGAAPGAAARCRPSARDAVLARVGPADAEPATVLDVAALTGSRVELPLLERGRRQHRRRARRAVSAPGSWSATAGRPSLPARDRPPRGRAGRPAAPPHRRHAADPRRAARGRQRRRRAAGLPRRGGGDAAGRARHARRAAAAAAGSASTGRRPPSTSGPCGSRTGSDAGRVRRRCTTGWPTSSPAGPLAGRGRGRDRRALALWHEAGDRLREGDTTAPASRICGACAAGPSRTTRSGGRGGVLEPLGPSRELAGRVAMPRRHGCGSRRHHEAGWLARRAQRHGRGARRSRGAQRRPEHRRCARRRPAASGGSRHAARRSEIALADGLRGLRPAGPTPTCTQPRAPTWRSPRRERCFTDGTAFCDDRRHQHVRHAACAAARPCCLRHARPVGRGGGQLCRTCCARQHLVAGQPDEPGHRLGSDPGPPRRATARGSVWTRRQLAPTAPARPSASSPARLARAEAFWLAGDLAGARREAEVAAGAHQWGPPDVLGAVAVWLRRLGSDRTVGGAIGRAVPAVPRRATSRRRPSLARSVGCAYDAALALIDSGDGGGPAPRRWTASTGSARRPPPGSPAHGCATSAPGPIPAGRPGRDPGPPARPDPRASSEVLDLICDRPHQRRDRRSGSSSRPRPSTTTSRRCWPSWARPARGAAAAAAAPAGRSPAPLTLRRNWGAAPRQTGERAPDGAPRRSCAVASVQAYHHDRRSTRMPLYMDVHTIDGGVAIDDVAKAHIADLQTQGKHDVQLPALLGRRGRRARSSAWSRRRPPTPPRPSTARRTAWSPTRSTRCRKGPDDSPQWTSQPVGVG